MPAPLPLPVRLLISRRAQKGQAVATIAHALNLRPRTVRNLLQRFAAQPDNLQPSYRPGPGRAATSQDLYDMAWSLRKEHPRWGAGYIRVRLADILSLAQTELPSERALQRWFRQHQEPPAPPGRRPAGSETASARARLPHDRWQMDAADQLRLASGEGVCWLRVADECTGAFLETRVFPPVLLGPRLRRGGSALLARDL